MGDTLESIAQQYKSDSRQYPRVLIHPYSRVVWRWGKILMIPPFMAFGHRTPRGQTLAGDVAQAYNRRQMSLFEVNWLRERCTWRNFCTGGELVFRSADRC